MKIKFLLLATLVLFISCQNTNSEKPGESTKNKAEIQAQLKDKSFDELFVAIPENQIPESVFDLVGSDFSVITSGTTAGYNSMVAGWGGWGILFNKPVTWNFLRADRYTLAYIMKEQTYTMSYFDEEFKEDIMLFGAVSGRDSEKMKESDLTPVETPLGSVTYKEAKLIIECKLFEVTSVHPDHFYVQEAKSFISEGYDVAKDYHKLVFGEITKVWKRR